MERFRFNENRFRPEAFLAFAVGVLIAYAVQVRLGFGGGGIFSALIVTLVGGAWYHWRKIL